MITPRNRLLYYKKIGNIHAERLTSALKRVILLMPITPEKLNSFPIDDIGLLDIISVRFSKLQDLIGARIFPVILELVSEYNDVTYIDKINRLEKLGYLSDAIWWQSLRDLRNELTHDYPYENELIAATNIKLLEQSQELLNFWGYLQEKLTPLTT